MAHKVTEDQFSTITKTLEQATKSEGLAKVKELTNSGKHQEASKLFNKLFPGI